MRLRVWAPAAFAAMVAAAPLHALEAETGSVAGEARVLSCAACSAGQRVGYIGRSPNNSLTLTFSSTGGGQTMTLYTTISGTRTLFYSVNGGPSGAITVSGT